MTPPVAASPEENVALRPSGDGCTVPTVADQLKVAFGISLPCGSIAIATRVARLPAGRRMEEGTTRIRSTAPATTITSPSDRVPAAVAEMTTFPAVVGAVKVPSPSIKPADAVQVAATPAQEFPAASVAVATKRSVLPATTRGECGLMDRLASLAGMTSRSMEVEMDPEEAVTRAMPASAGAVKSACVPWPSRATT